MRFAEVVNGFVGRGDMVWVQVSAGGGGGYGGREGGGDADWVLCGRCGNCRITIVSTREFEKPQRMSAKYISRLPPQ